MELPNHCPSCPGDLEVTALRCPSCGTEVGGAFPLPPLLRLSAEDLAFVHDFVRASGSLKELAKQYGRSYPTIRNRLNEIIRELSPMSVRSRSDRRRLLEQVAGGEISVEEALHHLNAESRDP